MAAKINDRALDLGNIMPGNTTTKLETYSILLFEEDELLAYLDFGKSGEVIANRRAFKQKDYDSK